MAVKRLGFCAGGDGALQPEPDGLGSWPTRWRVDHFGIGAHNTDYFPLSAGDVVLAAIAWRTSRVHLGSTVTVISSDDPMRVFEPYATLGAVSNGRVRMPDGCAMRLTDGYEAAARVLARALDLLLDVKPEDDVGRWRNSPVPASDTIALDLWDAESWHTLPIVRFGPLLRRVRSAICSSGSAFWPGPALSRGEFAAAALLIEEDRLIAEATGKRRLRT